MSMKPNEREYRSMVIERKKDDEESSCKVRGYASTFDEYELFNCDGVSYREKIEPTAFDQADMSDVIFLYNHEGMVYARQKNGTLNLSIDEHGLLCEADLSSTAASRELCESIRSGLIDQMSFAFTVADDEIVRGNDYTTRVIKRIGKLYDVSAVSIPANPGTDISVLQARDYFHGEMERRQTERSEREKALELAKAKFKYLEV